MAVQLSLDLPTRQAMGRDAFFVVPSNQIALAAIDAPDTWPARKLVIVGPHGSGKTHLAHVWAAEAPAKIISAATLATQDIPALVSHKNIVVEDADTIGQTPNVAEVEAALFHLHNLLLAEGGHLLITASTPPNQWALGLPDLASRMSGTTVVRIEAPDDALLSALLVKQFDDRQIDISPKLVSYILKRCERSADAIRTLVAALDKAALDAGKPVSQKLAAQVLDKLTQ